MTEYFDVDPGHVAGYGRLCEDVALDTNAIEGYVNMQASAMDGFDGVLMGELIAPIVDEYADAAQERIGTICKALYFSGRELTGTAWTYLGTDRPERFTMLEDEAGRGMVNHEVDHPQLVAYPHRPVDGELTAPTCEEADIEQLIDDHAGGTLEAIETIVSTVTGLIGDSFSITGEITDRITGNWKALDQKADALDHVADAAELAADGLESGQPTLDQHWDGGAATSFTSYLGPVIAGLRYEGPLNRVVAAAYRVASLLIEQAAGLVVELISAGVDIIRKWATGAAGRAVDTMWGWVSDGEPPWEAIKADWEQAKGLFTDAKAAADLARQVPDELRALIDATKSPEAAADYSVATALKDMVANKEIDEDTAGDYQLGYDIAKETGPALAEMDDLPTGDDLDNVPDEAFDAGDNLRRVG